MTGREVTLENINGGKVERETYGTSDVALGGKGAARCLERDMFYTLALDSRERGNKVVLESKYRVAIGHHSETILQFRPLVTETDCMWDDAACLMVRELSATAYLNLSLCSSRRSGGLTPCARQLTQKGDSRPPDPRDATLPSVKGAKALFRRTGAVRGLWERWQGTGRSAQGTWRRSTHHAARL